MAEHQGVGTECVACGFIEGEPPVGGTLLSTESWVVQHSVGPLGLGTTAVMPIRHVVHVADLTETEAGELGPVLQRVSAAVTAVLNPEQVYVCLWSHAGAVPGHLHFVVQPVLKDDLARYDAYGPVLQMAMFDSGVVPDEAAVRAVCVRLRAALASDAQPALPEWAAARLQVADAVATRMFPPTRASKGGRPLTGTRGHGPRYGTTFRFCKR